MTVKHNKRRPALRWAAFLVFVVGLGLGGWYLVFAPDTPLPRAWNPVAPLDVNDPYTPLTSWKLARALAEPELCLAALATGAQAQTLQDFTENEQCHIRPQIKLSQVGAARVVPFNTRCQTALRTAMWEHHGIQPAAKRHLATSVAEISHFSSYNCRAMRTSRGGETRMSTHATADAIDVSGFVLTDGRRITLLKDWETAGPEAAFLRDVRDSACRWFRVTLSPDYNSLHADHYHLQHTGWGLCR